MSGELLIYHVFADTGIESEALLNYGRVVRVGLDPDDLNGSEPVQADARELPLKPGADLAVLHPPCTKWSKLTHAPENHPDLIDRARQIGREYADEYIIENVPRAPLRDPVVLEGRMFGLPVKNERAFETSFHVEQPPRHRPMDVEADTRSHTHKSTEWWYSVMGYSRRYGRENIRTHAIPRAFIDYLLRAYDERQDAELAQPVSADGGTVGEDRRGDSA